MEAEEDVLDDELMMNGVEGQRPTLHITMDVIYLGVASSMGVEPELRMISR